jgi:hypothetical protein
MSISPIYRLSGWHTKESTTRENGPIPKNVIKYNALVIAGYLPATGIFSGICHLMLANQQGTLSTTKERVYFIIRGVLEIVGLGSLFLIPDLVVSIHRHFCAKDAWSRKLQKHNVEYLSKN